MISDKNNYYNYLLIDPRYYGPYKFGDVFIDVKPFYVGKGKNKRWLEHFNINKPNSNKEKVKIISELLSLGYKKEDLVRFLKSNILEQKIIRNEIFLISLFGREDLKTGILTNKTKGGDGVLEVNLTEEARKNYSESKQGERNPQFGLKGILSCNFGIKRDETFKEYLRNNNKIYDYVFENLITEDVVKINSLRKFCKTYHLERKQMMKVLSGKKFQFNGWIGYRISKENLRDKIEKETNVYTFCSPDGIFYQNIFNLRKFCRDHHLNYQNIFYGIKKGAINKWKIFINLYERK